jgi:hypothetical protein
MLKLSKTTKKEEARIDDIGSYLGYDNDGEEEEGDPFSYDTFDYDPVEEDEDPDRPID